MNRNFWRAYGLFAGGVIGVGMFGLPKALVASGLLVFCAHLVLVTVLVWCIHRWFLDVVLATNVRHRLPGYARTHLGTWGFRVAAVANGFGLLGALVAYLIAGGTFLRLLLGYFGDVPVAFATVAYLLPGALLLLWGVRALASLELAILVLFLLVLAMLPIAAAGDLAISRLPLLADAWSAAFLPYGVLLFSLWGLSLVPEAAELVARSRRRGRQALAAGILTAVLSSVVFALLIAGITGAATTEDALTGLRATLGDGVVVLTLVFGVLTTFSSYLALGLTLLRTLSLDFHLPRLSAWALVVFVPLALVFLGVRNLLPVLSLTGALFLGMEGLVVLAMRWSLCSERPSPRLQVALGLVALCLLGGVVSAFSADMLF